MGRPQQTQIIRMSQSSEEFSFVDEELVNSIKEGDLEKVKSAVESGRVSPNARLQSNQQQPWLCLAVNSERFEIVQFLVDAGADIEVEDEYHGTPLYKASYN